MKYFLITVDTEGDNLWNWSEGQKITTENCLSIPRFQELCEKYGFIPTYLTNYEMAMEDRWVDYAREKCREGKCEIGLHIHAWNSPPDFQLNNIYGGNPYITEYPDSIAREKILMLKKILEDRFATQIKSARSGRWATDRAYFSALTDAGITADCSVTPGLNLSHIPGCSTANGPDYSRASCVPSVIYPGIMEIPMSTRMVRWNGEGSVKRKIKSRIFGEELWLRPIKLSKAYLLQLTKSIIAENKTDYLEFMLHSSELMAGGSPYFKTEDDIKKLYDTIEWYFDYISKLGYSGISVSQYAEKQEAL